MVFINIMVLAVGRLVEMYRRVRENDAGERREKGVAALYSRCIRVGSITTAFSKKHDKIMPPSAALKHGVFSMRHLIPWVCQLEWRIWWI